jgi:cytochrome c
MTLLIRRALGVCGAVWCLMAVAAVPTAAVRQTTTVADGVYAAEQADRGRKGYALFCESCHAADLSGTNSGDSGAPPLRREGFMEGSDANALYTKIRETMPLDAPESLTREEYLDILAFVFRENGFPAGALPLPTDPDRLRAIRIVRVPSRR